MVCAGVPCALVPERTCRGSRSARDGVVLRQVDLPVSSSSKCKRCSRSMTGPFTSDRWRVIPPSLSRRLIASRLSTPRRRSPDRGPASSGGAARGRAPSPGGAPAHSRRRSPGAPAAAEAAGRGSDHSSPSASTSSRTCSLDFLERAAARCPAPRSADAASRRRRGARCGAEERSGDADRGIGDAARASRLPCRLQAGFGPDLPRYKRRIMAPRTRPGADAGGGTGPAKRPRDRARRPRPPAARPPRRRPRRRSTAGRCRPRCQM